MDLLLSMSIFTSAAGVSGEKARAQEWMKSWVGGHDGDQGQGAAVAAEQGKAQEQRRQEEPRTPKKKQQQRRQGGRPWCAPEFDGINCFETLVSR